MFLITYALFLTFMPVLVPVIEIIMKFCLVLETFNSNNNQLLNPKLSVFD